MARLSAVPDTREVLRRSYDRDNSLWKWELVAEQFFTSSEQVLYSILGSALTCDSGGCALCSAPPMFHKDGNMSDEQGSGQNNLSSILSEFESISKQYGVSLEDTLAGSLSLSKLYINTLENGGCLLLEEKDGTCYKIVPESELGETPQKFKLIPGGKIAGEAESGSFSAKEEQRARKRRETENGR